MEQLLRAGVLALAVTLAMPGCDQQAGVAPKPGSAVSPRSTLDDERQRVSYMVGLDLAKQIAPIQGEVDIDTVVQALRTAVAGQTPLLDAAQTTHVREDFTAHLRDTRETAQRMMATKNLADGIAFLAQHRQQPNIVTTDSGLQYEVLQDAVGAKPKPGDTVKVNYIGTLLDGRKFEDTYAIDHPATFALNQVMPGLTEAVQRMPVGGRYRFWLPATLAYGETGLPGQIEPNATLIFEIELLEIAGQAP
ncbi:MAG: FKBP-type peptidyl-prolyl cis-trans isomerase [Tahibacter sp.]